MADAAKGTPTLVIALIMTSFFAFAPLLASAYAIPKFNSRKIDKKHTTKGLMSLFFVLSSIAALFDIAAIVIYNGGSLFNHENADLAFILLIVCIGINVACFVGVFVMIYFFAHLVGIGMTEDSLYVQLDSAYIKKEKIISIVDDKQRKAYYINYKVGNRKISKLKFPKQLVISQFINSLFHSLGFTPIETNEIEYLKEENQKLKIESQKKQAELLKQISKNTAAKKEVSKPVEAKSEKKDDVVVENTSESKED